MTDDIKDMVTITVTRAQAVLSYALLSDILSAIPTPDKSDLLKIKENLSAAVKALKEKI